MKTLAQNPAKYHNPVIAIVVVSSSLANINRYSTTTVA